MKSGKIGDTPTSDILNNHTTVDEDILNVAIVTEKQKLLELLEVGLVAEQIDRAPDSVHVNYQTVELLAAFEVTDDIAHAQYFSASDSGQVKGFAVVETSIRRRRWRRRRCGSA